MPVRVRKGIWVVDVTYRHPDGTSQRVVKRSPVQTEKGAGRYEKQLVHALATGQYKKPKAAVPTVQDFSMGYLERYATNNKKSSARSERHLLAGHVLPLLGRLRVDSVGYADVEALKAKLLEKKLSPKSINNAVSALTGLLQDAKRVGHLKLLPEVKWLRVPKPQVDFITEAQFQRLHDAAEPAWQPMFLFAVHTGLRLGELCALHWGDIDPVLKQMQVRHNVVRGVLGTPKGGSEAGQERIIPLNKRAQAALTAQRALGVRGVLVFPSPRGKPWSTYNAPTMAMARASRQAKLGRAVTWKVLRSTFASWLIQRGATVKEVQELLGHGSLEVTMRYMALSPSERQRAVRLLDLPARTSEDSVNNAVRQALSEEN